MTKTMPLVIAMPICVKPPCCLCRRTQPSVGHRSLGRKGIHPADSDLGILDSLTVLDIDATDFGEGVTGANELGDTGDLGVGVDGLALTVERLVTHVERIEARPSGSRRPL